jgi:UDP-glucose 4-epimerase
MKIFITGVAGFIGSNLARALLEKGYEVAGLDNLSQGYLLNMEEFQENPRFTFFKDDIRDEAAMTHAAQDCDVVVHLAAYKIPRYSDALDTLLINSQGTDTVLKVAARQKSKVVVASTSDVYGKNPQVPFCEDSNLVIGQPQVKRWSYAISKMFEEQLVFAYHERYGIDGVCLRFFGGYGPNQNLTWWGGPQSVFIDAALDDKELPLHGDGSQTRSFTFVSDHVAGIIAAIEKEQANNQVFNIGNTHEITIRQLAETIWCLIHGSTPPKLEYIPYETFGKYEDVIRRVPDISLARSLLGFEPEVDLQTGLKQTILWQIQRRRVLGIPTADVEFPEEVDNGIIQLRSEALPDHPGL